MNIRFVSYDGKWPNLCSGILVLEINGENVSFSSSYKKPEGSYESFWTSGGNACLRNDECVIDKGEWIINYDELPKFLQPYYHQISEIFNENVPYGCCGGCI